MLCNNMGDHWHTVRRMGYLSRLELAPIVGSDYDTGKETRRRTFGGGLDNAQTGQDSPQGSGQRCSRGN